MSGRKGMLHYSEELKEHIRQEVSERKSQNAVSREYEISRYTVQSWCGIFCNPQEGSESQGKICGHLPSQDKVFCACHVQILFRVQKRLLQLCKESEPARSKRQMPGHTFAPVLVCPFFASLFSFSFGSFLLPALVTVLMLF